MTGAPQFHPRDFRRGLRHAGLTDGEYRVAIELSEFAGIDRPVVWPSIPTLAENCCIDERSVRRILHRLEAKGVIACIVRSKGGRGHTNQSRLCVLPQETLTDGSGFMGDETLTDGSVNPDPTCRKTLTGGSGEVVIEEEKKGGRARTREPRNPRAVPDADNAPPPPNLNGEQPSATAADSGPPSPPQSPDENEPPRFCPQHPHGTERPCHGCRLARLEHEDWIRDHYPDTAEVQIDVIISDQQRAEAQARRNCELCYGTAVNVDAAGHPDLDGTYARSCRPDNPIAGCPNWHA